MMHIALRLFLLVFFAVNLAAQTPRYALVVGNANYANASLGQTPINDANAMRDALTLAGFQVDCYTDLDQTRLNNAVTAFGRKIKDTKGVALFYYSGHGVQHNNQNYLVPIGAELTEEEDIEVFCTPIGRITAKMLGAGASINLVVLDACRAFPLSRSNKSLTQGLTKENYAVPELLVAYATAPGSTATVRGEGGLSLFTSQLLKHLKTPGLVLENVLKNTRLDVISKSNGQQRPDQTSNLTQDFYFFSDGVPSNPNDIKQGGATSDIYQPDKFPRNSFQNQRDQDLDSIPDEIDRCPDEYGTSSAYGCPDYDDDGVPDRTDKCPRLSGKKNWQGCPDSDGDGLPDHEDKCPYKRGETDENGCPPPDSDNDGILDIDDKCPLQAGVPQHQGCPDTDSDGVPDQDDACPERKGKPVNSGCPDSDGDGIIDFKDRCPFEYGEPEYEGCMEPDIKANNMVLVLGDTFDMGQGGSKPEFVHPVALSDFYISKYEVTYSEFCAFLNDKGNQVENGIPWLGPRGYDGYEEHLRIRQKDNGKFEVHRGFGKHPVTFVSWYGARAYCEWLSQKTGKVYRLPTEAEWEFAARDRGKMTLYAGTNIKRDLADYANFCDAHCSEVDLGDTSRADGYVFTAPVGSFKPNELGLYDMSGNVIEWCHDEWSGFYFTSDLMSNPKGPNYGRPYRFVVRGGCWRYRDLFCETTSRDRQVDADKTSSEVGFRVVREVGDK